MATASRKATTLVIGDLAFLHDLNSLALVKDLEIPFPIILINNGGGGIFHFLPVVRQTDIFERFFGTPHHLSDFRPIATQFSLNYHSAETTDEFTTVYREARSTPGATLIELQGDRQSGPDHHLEIYARIKQNFQNG